MFIGLGLVISGIVGMNIGIGYSIIGGGIFSVNVNIKVNLNFVGFIGSFVIN